MRRVWLMVVAVTFAASRYAAIAPAHLTASQTRMFVVSTPHSGGSAGYYGMAER